MNVVSNFDSLPSLETLRFSMLLTAVAERRAQPEKTFKVFYS